MTPNQEHALAVLVVLVICGMAIYRLVQWIMEAPSTPDPWPKEEEDAVQNEAAVPVCHHCLTPQEHSGWFCPECGAKVGQYCNYMPYIYVFSEGEVLRAGATERLRHSWLVVVGFFLFSIAAFALAAPIYWFFLLKNLRRRTPAEVEPVLGG